MTLDAIDEGADTLIWPESTVPLTYAMTDFYREWVESTSEFRGVDIILGSVAEDANDPDAIWNSAYLVREGETKARYDKIRLVPFNEYVPLRGHVPWPRFISDGLVDARAGEERISQAV